ncbi:MAG: hypothetical protein ACRCS8_02025 [Brevinema sp.]
MANFKAFLEQFKVPTPSPVEETPAMAIPQDFDLEDMTSFLEFIFSQDEIKTAIKAHLEDLFNSDDEVLKTSPTQNVERISHRFEGKKYAPSRGMASLARGLSIEETEIFADEVEKLCKEGLDRRSAYTKARQNLMNQEH